MFIIMMMFTTGALGQEQWQVPEVTEEPNICSVLTEFGFYQRYRVLHEICNIRGYISGMAGRTIIPSDECISYIFEQILSREPKTEENLPNLIMRYMSEENRKEMSVDLQFHLSSMEQTLSTKCGVTVTIERVTIESLKSELSVEQQEKEVFKTIDCISKEITLRKKQYCSI